jgi:hypothetical protein
LNKSRYEIMKVEKVILDPCFLNAFIFL